MPVRIAHDNGQHPAVKRYKHSMRKSPYLVSLFLLLAATALTLLNIHVRHPCLLQYHVFINS